MPAYVIARLDLHQGKREGSAAWLKKIRLLFQAGAGHDYYKRNCSHHHDLDIDGRRGLLWHPRRLAAQKAETRGAGKVTARQLTT